MVSANNTMLSMDQNIIHFRNPILHGGHTQRTNDFFFQQCSRNTIGFKYWLFRFIFQCCFYLLVLTAVFSQVYKESYDPMTGVFIAIVAMSGILLLLELHQFFKNMSHYVRYGRGSYLCPIVLLLCNVLSWLYDH
jgi:hypothetical protein